MINQDNFDKNLNFNLFDNIEKVSAKKTLVAQLDQLEINSILFYKNSLYVVYKDRFSNPYISKYKKENNLYKFVKKILESNNSSNIKNIYKYKKIFLIEDEYGLKIYKNLVKVHTLNIEINFLTLNQNFIIIFNSKYDLKLYETENFNNTHIFKDFKDNPIIYMKLNEKTVYLFNKKKVYLILNWEEKLIEEKVYEIENKSIYSKSNNFIIYFFKMVNIYIQNLNIQIF